MSFASLVVREEDGQLIRLGDIADVVLGAEDYDTEVRFSQKQAVFMGIWVLPNANSIDVVKRVRTELEDIKRELPTGMKGDIAYDATQYINDAIHEVIETLSETLLIVVIVIFLFLGSLRSALMPVVAIPDLAHRRGFPHAGLWVHHKSAHSPRDRALGRSGGR